MKSFFVIVMCLALTEVKGKPPLVSSIEVQPGVLCFTNEGIIFETERKKKTLFTFSKDKNLPFISIPGLQMARATGGDESVVRNPIAKIETVQGIVLRGQGSDDLELTRNSKDCSVYRITLKTFDFPKGATYWKVRK